MTRFSRRVLFLAVTLFVGASGSRGEEGTASDAETLLPLLEGDLRFELFAGDAKEPTELR
jgi:hypothetical protein